MVTDKLTLLVDDLGAKLKKRKLVVTTAESCTGGGISSAFTSVSGSSNWFKAGVVTYSNEMKESILGVNRQTLLRDGAVSEATTREMLEGVLKLCKADIGITVSGIAGPDGAVPSKPVGTVCFSWGSEDCHFSTTEHFTGDRNQVRKAATEFAVMTLRDYLERKSTV